MDIPQDITIVIGNDITKVWEDWANLEDSNYENTISKQEYFKKIYILTCKAGYLKAVVEEAKTQGVKFVNAQISILDEILDRLSEIADMKNMEELSEKDEKSINEFAYKYKDVIPEEYLEDLIDLD